MKNKIFSLILSLMFISSFGASALDNQSLKNRNFTGWRVDKDTQQTYYFKNGDMVKQSWISPNGYSYYLKDDGVLANEWLQLNDNWYYFTNKVGTMVNCGWYSINDKKYYFNTNGTMATGWLMLEEKWYYLNTDGTMAQNTTIDGYTLGPDGSWVK